MTEAQLLERVATGDERALEELHAMLAPKVFALAMRMLRVREEAEEVLQDTFVHLYRDLTRRATGHATGPEHPRAFVYTIARNLCLSRLRARSTRPVIAADLELEEVGSQSSGPVTTDPVDRVVVRAALARLAVDERSLLEAMYFDGWSHSELAERASLPLGTVKAKLRRALLKLRGILEPA